MKMGVARGGVGFLVVRLQVSSEEEKERRKLGLRRREMVPPFAIGSRLFM